MSIDAKNINKLEDKPKPRPPTILVYTKDQNDLFERIVNSLKQLLPRDTYTFSHLSTKALKFHPWMDENVAFLFIADTTLLDDQAWIKLQSYSFGKILFVCQNSLVTNLTNSDSVEKQLDIIKREFEKKIPGASKDFENFMISALKMLDECEEVNEIFYTHNPVDKYKYSVVFSKHADQPLMLYAENTEHVASALFSDATTDQLLSLTDQKLMADILNKLNIEIKPNEPIPKLTQGYMLYQNDQLVLNIDGLLYGDEFGEDPKLVFRPTEQLDVESLPDVDSTLLPIEVRRRKTAVPNNMFDTHLYFNRLQTQSIGRVFLYVPVCETTIKICKSWQKAFPNFDGVIVNAGAQVAGIGRGGNQWISPKGSILFSFTFNVLLDSELGKNITFLQHILAVSTVHAILSLLKLPDFPLRIKWPNDIYYKELYKMGGILVTASADNVFARCIISAGLNVANSKPTVCLNSLLPADHAPLTVEETLAEIINKFEHYVNFFVHHGKLKFIKEYEKIWLHTGEEVSIIHETSGPEEKVVIKGLDSDGYLEVRSKETGKLFSVSDDGNTFDRLKGLIRPKQ